MAGSEIAMNLTSETYEAIDFRAKNRIVEGIKSLSLTNSHLPAFFESIQGKRIEKMVFPLG